MPSISWYIHFVVKWKPKIFCNPPVQRDSFLKARKEQKSEPYPGVHRFTRCTPILPGVQRVTRCTPIHSGIQRFTRCTPIHSGVSWFSPVYTDSPRFTPIPRMMIFLWSCLPFGSEWTRSIQQQSFISIMFELVWSYGTWHCHGVKSSRRQEFNSILDGVFVVYVWAVYFYNRFECRSDTRELPGEGRYPSTQCAPKPYLLLN